ncbi:MAG: DedA family protein [Planctomycetes bacterium]|nr:DedA family protein [Planctomycetota bacterium]
MISLAAHPRAEFALFGIAFIESSFFPIPPDVLQIAMTLAERTKAFRHAFISAAGSVLGGILGYGIGWGLWLAVKGVFIPYIFSQETFDNVQNLYQKYDFWCVFIAAFTPIPYKVFTIAAGVCQIAFLPFVLASAIGRAGRFFLVATLLYLFGERVRALIEKYFEWITLLLAAGIIGGFYAIRFIRG